LRLRSRAPRHQARAPRRQPRRTWTPSSKAWAGPSPPRLPCGRNQTRSP